MQRDTFRPAPQPAVGAGQTSRQRHPTLAANDAVAPRRSGRYNWDGRYISQPVSGGKSPSLARTVLFPAGALALLAGVAFGAFYLMHTFAAGPDAAVANAAAPAKAETTVAAAMEMPAVSAEAPKAGVAGGQDHAARIAAPAAAQVKMAAVAPSGVAVAGMKVPAPDNARWGEAAASAKAAAAPQTEEADAAPEVNDPQSAPVPTQPPKAEAPQKLAYAEPSQAAAPPVDKAVTAALPPAGSSKETGLPGVNPAPLSVPDSAAAAKAGDSRGGYMSTVHTAVRLHAGPSNGSRSIGVVPKKATVHVLNCQSWCKVSYEGKEGYIFKNFLGHASASAPAAAAPEKTAAAQSAAAKPAATAPADAKALEAAGERTMMRR